MCTRPAIPKVYFVEPKVSVTRGTISRVPLDVLEKLFYIIIGKKVYLNNN